MSDEVLQEVEDRAKALVNSRELHSYDKAFLPIKVFTEYASIEEKGIEKNISLLDLYHILSRSIKGSEEDILKTLLLPQGTFAIAHNQKSLKISCYYPEVKKEVTHKSYSHDNEATFLIPFPNTIITHTLAREVINDMEWSVTNSKYYVTPKRVPQLPLEVITGRIPDNVFSMPFNNFYGDDKMCFGGNRMPQKFGANLRGLDYYYQVIFLSPFNDDLGIKGVTDYRTYSGNNRKFYQMLSKLDSFPYDKLSDTGSSY